MMPTGSYIPLICIFEINVLTRREDEFFIKLPITDFKLLFFQHTRSTMLLKGVARDISKLCTSAHNVACFLD